MADCGRRLEEWRTVDGACLVVSVCCVLMSGASFALRVLPATWTVACSLLYSLELLDTTSSRYVVG